MAGTEPEPDPEAGDPSLVETTRTSLDLLATVRESDGATLRDVVEANDVVRSTAHRHLTTLREAGYLRKAGETYHLGLRFLEMGEHARTRWDWHDDVRGVVEALAERTAEDCDFVVEDDGRVITVAESFHKWVKYHDEGKRYRADVGTYYPMHATGSGLAILASKPDDRVEAIVERRGLPALTDHTITDREALFAELRRTRERGHAVGDQYYTEGLRSVARVVTRPDGTVLGAVSVSGPTYRIDGAVLEAEIPEALATAVERVEADLDDDVAAR